MPSKEALITKGILISDCPEGYITIYQDEERTMPPLCLKFHEIQDDFCGHERRCELEGLSLAEPRQEYAMDELQTYLKDTPGNKHFFLSKESRARQKNTTQKCFRY